VSVVFGVCYIRKVYFRSQFVLFLGGGAWEKLIFGEGLL